MNEGIKVEKVRLIGKNGEQIGIVSLRDALLKAQEEGLDLVEVSPGTNPPVCKLLDYGKHKYMEEKKERQARKKQKTGEVKEVKIRPKIESHDLEVKMKNVFRFLSSGNKVKLSIIFSGREISYKDFGKELLENILNKVKNKFSVDLSLFNENRYIGAMITPKSEIRRERDAKNENS